MHQPNNINQSFQDVTYLGDSYKRLHIKPFRHYNPLISLRVATVHITIQRI